MTEAEWLACSDSTPMREYVRRKVGKRKVRLFMVAVCRHIWHLLYGCSRRAVEVGELYADGVVTRSELQKAVKELLRDRFSEREPNGIELPDDFGTNQAAYYAACPLDSVKNLLKIVSPAVGFALGGVYHYAISKGMSEKLAADQKERERVYQSVLFREIIGNPFRPATINPAWLTSTVIALANGIYEEKAFDRMPILADALQDAGCDNDEILQHCRGEGVHVRGCWVLDLVTGRK